MSDNQQPSSENRVCRVCGKSKSLDDFQLRECAEDRIKGIPKEKRRRYRRHTCIECDKQHKKELSQVYYETNKRRIMRRITAYRRSHPESYRDDANRRSKRFRETVIQAYGGPKCACCGETHVCMLTLDHINGGGRKHRREIADLKGWKHRVAGIGFYRHLIEQGFPPGYQVLCFNCNYSKHLLGTCVHKLREGSTVIPTGSRSKGSEARNNSDEELMI